MTPAEILSEIRKMALNDVREIVEKLTNYLREREKAAITAKQSEAQEDEFEHHLLAKGVISHIPARDETEEEFDAFEPIEVDGETLSETIIRERR